MLLHACVSVCVCVIVPHTQKPSQYEKDKTDQMTCLYQVNLSVTSHH